MMDVSFINLPSPGGSLDHTLYSPDMSNYPSTSPQSVFMYEHDEGPDRGKSSQSVFEFPRPMEINDLGGELNTSFWSDCEGSLLETSFGDSGKASLWDFSGFDDISSPLQHPEDDLTCTPTLAELNNEDSQSFDAMLSSHNACIVPAAHKAKLRLHHNNNNVTLKTQCGMAGPASDVSSDSPRSQERVLVDQEPLIWPNSSPLSVKLGARSHKEKETKGIERLTLKTTHDSHHHHHPAKMARKLFSRQGLDSALGISDVTANEKGEHLEQAWQEVPSFVHHGGTDRQTNKVCRTKSSPEGKRLTIKEELYTHRAFTSGAGDGYDSHDEGLGSEHEDQDEEDNENIKEEEEEEEDGLSDMGEEYDACSDMSEDHGVATTSTATQDLFPQKVKSRRSEYDDLTPNPKRLLLIGNELHKLNKVISGMIPVSALPVSARNRSRKEKNKLASRACRLKKKAQHEANKLKLFGLEKEHDRLMQVITAIRRELLIYLEQPPKDPPCLSDKLNTLIQSILGQMVANHTQEFVSSVLEKTAHGSKLMGGLSFLTTHD